MALLIQKMYANMDPSQLNAEADELTPNQQRIMKELDISQDELLEAAAAEGFKVGSQSALYRRYMRWQATLSNHSQIRTQTCYCKTKRQNTYHQKRKDVLCQPDHQKRFAHNWICQGKRKLDKKSSGGSLGERNCPTMRIALPRWLADMVDEKAKWDAAAGAKRKAMVREWISKQFDEYQE